MTISKFNQKTSLLAVGALSIGIVSITINPQNAEAGVLRIGESAFTTEAGLITFSEFAVGTVNPTYNPADYGGDPTTAPIVSFGGFFEGQSLGDAASCPPDAAITGCVIGTPTDSLTLDLASPSSFITTDLSNPTSPVLSGTPTFNGAISILFDEDVAGVGLDGGFFNAIGGTAITAFARDGSVVGSVDNEALGIEFLGLVTDDQSESIAGLQFSLVGAEPAGFAIDNVRFGMADEIVNPDPDPDPTAVPEPASILGLLALGAFGTTSLKRKKNS